MTDKTLGVIREVRCGCDDGVACLRFTVYVSESRAALQSLSWDEAGRLIEAYGVEDVARLDGKHCWVDTSNPGLMSWVGPAII